MRNVEKRKKLGKSTNNKKVNYRKQIMCQHLCHNFFWHRWGCGRASESFPRHVDWSPCKICLLCVILCERMYRRSPKFGVLEPHSLEWRSCLTLFKYAPPLICYHIEFGQFTSNAMGVGRSPKHWGRWEPGRGWPVEIRPSLTCYLTKFGLSKSMVRA